VCSPQVCSPQVPRRINSAYGCLIDKARMPDLSES
jgi:hypothetical protein